MYGFSLTSTTASVFSKMQVGPLLLVNLYTATPLSLSLEDDDGVTKAPLPASVVVEELNFVWRGLTVPGRSKAETIEETVAPIGKPH